MTKFTLMVTQDGKHPPSKWAERIADEIIEISAHAPEALMKDAVEFRNQLVGLLTGHVHEMAQQEQNRIKVGKHNLDLPYETEDYAETAADEIIGATTAYSFAAHFQQPHVRDYLITVLNRYFKSAQLVERHHYHSEKARIAGTKTKNK